MSASLTTEHNQLELAGGGDIKEPFYLDADPCCATHRLFYFR